MPRKQQTELKRQVRKICIILLILAGSLLLTGFGLSPRNVELKTDKALIDLDILVKDSLPGKYGNPESGLKGKTEDTLTEGEETKKDEQADAKGKEAGTATVTEIRVEIRDTDITVNGVSCPNARAAAEKVHELYRVGLKVYLVDDYAEYQTYKDTYDKMRAESISLIEVVND